VNYRIERVRWANDDLDELFDFLVQTFESLGDDLESAVDRASGRVGRIKTDMRALGAVPHQGTPYPQLMPGLRSVTKDRAIFYFIVDDEMQVVRVLAVFFGGQDHQRLMLRRLLGDQRE
jgi:plasmid stabilization system protein ParE